MSPLAGSSTGLPANRHGLRRSWPPVVPAGVSVTAAPPPFLIHTCYVIFSDPRASVDTTIHVDWLQTVDGLPVRVLPVDRLRLLANWDPFVVGWPQNEPEIISQLVM